MSEKFPPRVCIDPRTNQTCNNWTGEPVLDYVQYLSLAEHEHLIREARAEAFEEAARMSSEYISGEIFREDIIERAAAIREGKE